MASQFTPTIDEGVPSAITGQDIPAGARITGGTRTGGTAGQRTVNSYFNRYRSRVGRDIDSAQRNYAISIGNLEETIRNGDAQIARLQALQEKYGVNADEMQSIEILLQEKLNRYTFDLAKGSITSVANTTGSTHADKLTKIIDGMSDKLSGLLNKFKSRGGNPSKVGELANKGLKKFKGAGAKLGKVLDKLNLVQRVADAEDVVLGSLSRATGNYSSGLREELHGFLDEHGISDVPVLGQLATTVGDVGADIMELLGLNTGYKTDKEMVEGLKKGIETQIAQQGYAEGRQTAFLREIERLEANRDALLKTEANLVETDFKQANEAQLILQRNPNLADMSYRQQQKALKKILEADTNYLRKSRKQQHDQFVETAKWIHRISNPDAEDVKRRDDLMRRGAYQYVDIKGADRPSVTGVGEDARTARQTFLNR